MSSYRIEFIAGGVLRDADGNILDDSSEKAAQDKLRKLELPNLIEGEQE